MIMLQGWLKLDQIGWKWFKHVQTCSNTQLRHHVAKANMQHTLRLLQWCERLLVIKFSSPDGKLEELNRAALQALLSFLRDTCCGGTRCFWSWLCRSFVYNAVKHNLVDGVPWPPCKPSTRASFHWLSVRNYRIYRVIVAWDQHVNKVDVKPF